MLTSVMESALEWAANFKKRWAFGKNILARFPAWATPNRVTVFRTVLLLPIAWCLSESYDGWALILYAVSSALDFVDGALAHFRNQHTVLGKFLDPLSDKIVNCGVLLLAINRLPLGFGPPIVFICSCAIGNTSLRLWRMARAYRATGSVDQAPTSAKDVGKLKTVFEIAATILLLLGLHGESAVVVWTGGLVLAAAALLAARSFWVQYQTTH